MVRACIRRTTTLAAGLVAGLLLTSISGIRASDAEERRPGAAGQLALQAASAREAGDLDRAESLLRRALALEPDSDDLLVDLATLEDDAESAAGWALYAALRRTDDDGDFELPSAVSDAAGALLPEVREIVTRRLNVANAVRSEKSTGPEPLTRAERAFLDEIAAVALRGMEESGAVGRPPARRPSGRQRRRADVVSGLTERMYELYRRKSYEETLRHARLLAAIHTRAARRDNDDAGASRRGRQSAIGLLASCRIEIREKLRAWRREELESLSASERRSWNERHATWTHPGVALTADRMYRVESTGGVAVLLQTVAAVERSHARLVAFYGKDPLTHEQGVVRVVRDELGLEREGRIRGWAAGWQSGRFTTFLWPRSRLHLDEVVTHELTHRFDKRLFPGLPTWACEGRAEYNETAILDPDADELDLRYISRYAIRRARELGYTEKDALTRLIDRGPTDYRHNYVAGYALWTFLRRGLDDTPSAAPAGAYAEKTRAFLALAAAPTRRNARRTFVETFLDGEDGRAADMDEFVAQFAEFCDELLNYSSRPSWAQSMIEQSDRARATVNRGKWTTEELRAAESLDDREAERVIRAANAREAARLLAAGDDVSATLEALDWAATEGGLDDTELGDLIDGIRIEPDEPEARMGLWLARRMAGRTHAPPPPTSGRLASVLRTVRSTIAAFDDRRTELAKSGLDRMAELLRFERNALAALVGAPIARATPGDGPAAEAPSIVCPPAIGLLAGGPLLRRRAVSRKARGFSTESVGPSRAELGWLEPTDAVSEKDADDTALELTCLTSLSRRFSIETRLRVGDVGSLGAVRFGTNRESDLKMTVDGPIQGAESLRATRTDLDEDGASTVVKFERVAPRPGETSARIRVALEISGRRVKSVARDVSTSSSDTGMAFRIDVAGARTSVAIDGEEVLVHLGDGVRAGRAGVALRCARGTITFVEPTIRHHHVGSADACSCPAPKRK